MAGLLCPAFRVKSHVKLDNRSKNMRVRHACCSGLALETVSARRPGLLVEYEEFARGLPQKIVLRTDAASAAELTLTLSQVELNPDAGSVEEGKLFTTAGLRLANLPRFGVPRDEKRFEKKFRPVTLTARVEVGERDAGQLRDFYPLGGERQRQLHRAAAIP